MQCTVHYIDWERESWKFIDLFCPFIFSLFRFLSSSGLFRLLPYFVLLFWFGLFFRGGGGGVSLGRKKRLRGALLVLGWWQPIHSSSRPQVELIIKLLSPPSYTHIPYLSTVFSRPFSSVCLSPRETLSFVCDTANLFSRMRPMNTSSLIGEYVYMHQRNSPSSACWLV